MDWFELFDEALNVGSSWGIEGVVETSSGALLSSISTSVAGDTILGSASGSFWAGLTGGLAGRILNEGAMIGTQYALHELTGGGQAAVGAARGLTQPGSPAQNVVKAGASGAGASGAGQPAPASPLALSNSTIALAGIGMLGLILYMKD